MTATGREDAAGLESAEAVGDLAVAVGDSSEVEAAAATNTPSQKPYDVVIVGGGIVGAATALALADLVPGKRLAVLEAEDGLARHQTGHNSGVIHSGLYYKPGSLKARLCVSGREAMYRFAQEHGIPHERCGKVVVATTTDQLGAMEELERRGRENGLTGVRRLGPEELREREPHTSGLAALLVPETGIIDYPAVNRTMIRLVMDRGHDVITGARVTGFGRDGAEGGATPSFVLETPKGPVRAQHLIGCAGLQSDRLARLTGVNPGLRIVPFRGEYYEIKPARQDLVRHLIYPVPDPRFPFLGVHFTRMIHGGVEAGPNAVLALRREGYSRFSLSLRDLFSFVFYKGFWRMAARHWWTGMGEVWRSFSRRAFVKALRCLVPELTVKDVRRGGAGVRAQALEPTGVLADDFRIVEGERMFHVLNAPSPAATAALSIGQELAERAARSFAFRAPEVGRHRSS